MDSVIIKFGATDKTIQGDSLEQVIKDEVNHQVILTLQKSGKELNADQIEYVKTTVLSAREMEKIIIKEIAAAVQEQDKTGVTFLALADLYKRIKSSKDSLMVTASEINILRKSFEELKKRPMLWLYADSLIRQIIYPVITPVDMIAEPVQ